jgi:hypothetical protein
MGVAHASPAAEKSFDAIIAPEQRPLATCRASLLRGSVRCSPSRLLRGACRKGTLLFQTGTPTRAEPIFLNCGAATRAGLVWSAQISKMARVPGALQ